MHVSGWVWDKAPRAGRGRGGSATGNIALSQRAAEHPFYARIKSQSTYCGFAKTFGPSLKLFLNLFECLGTQFGFGHSFQAVDGVFQAVQFVCCVHLGSPVQVSFSHVHTLIVLHCIPKNQEATQIDFRGVALRQHRGEGSGMAASDNGRYVRQVFNMTVVPIRRALD